MESQLLLNFTPEALKTTEELINPIVQDPFPPVYDSIKSHELVKELSKGPG